MAKKLPATTTTKVQKSDIEIIARLEPGYGAAFKRMREAAGLTQAQLAEAVGVDATGIVHYEKERFRPKPEVLKRALLAMGADPRTLFRYFDLSPEVKAILDKQLSPEEAAMAVGQILLEGTSNEMTLSAIFDFMSPKVLAALSIRALRDTKSAELFFSQEGKFRESQTPRRRAERAENVSDSGQFVTAQRRNGDEPIEAEAKEVQADTGGEMGQSKEVGNAS